MTHKPGDLVQRTIENPKTGRRDHGVVVSAEPFIVDSRRLRLLNSMPEWWEPRWPVYGPRRETEVERVRRRWAGLYPED